MNENVLAKQAEGPLLHFDGGSVQTDGQGTRPVKGRQRCGGGGGGGTGLGGRNNNTGHRWYHPHRPPPTDQFIRLIIAGETPVRSSINGSGFQSFGRLKTLTYTIKIKNTASIRRKYFPPAAADIRGHRALAPLKGGVLLTLRHTGAGGRCPPPPLPPDQASF